MIKKKATLYKAVHKIESENGCRYVSDYNPDFIYQIGAVIKEDCDQDVSVPCSFGIHISHLNWALCFGSDFKDLAVLEIETDIDNIVLPLRSEGKVRTSEIKVLREIPLEECGAYGKILAKRRRQDDEK